MQFRSNCNARFKYLFKKKSLITICSDPNFCRENASSVLLINKDMSCSVKALPEAEKSKSIPFRQLII